MIKANNFDNMEEIHMGETLRAILEEQGRSQAWLAKKLDISHQAVNAMLNAKRFRESRIEKLSEILSMNFAKEARIRSVKNLRVVRYGMQIRIAEDGEHVENSPAVEEFLGNIERLLKSVSKLTPEERALFFKNLNVFEEKRPK